MPPLPSPPGQRDRRNLAQAEWVTITDADGVEREIPPFPGRRPPAAALEYWTLIWSSPLATMYLATDRVPLARVCRLHAKVQSGKATGAELSQLGQLEDRYGLSPTGRRRLQWEVEKAGGPGSAHSRQPHDDLQRRRDARRRLTA